MAAGLFTIEFYEDEHGNAPVLDWMENDLNDVELAALDAALGEILGHFGVGVCGTEWGKHLGDGLFEFRIRHTADEITGMRGKKTKEKVLLRVFCHAYGDKVVLLLAGYDKGADPSGKRQQKEIARARKRLTEWELRRAVERKWGRR